MHMDDCGYCTLLGHSPLLSSDAIVLSSPQIPCAPILLDGAACTLYIEPVLSANPRGPPVAALA